jgi:predicted ABC-class ATPase
MTDVKELLSEDLLHQLEEAARAQDRKPAELLQEAVRKYLDDLSWVAFVETNERRARANGITEEDVPRFVEEVRRENAERVR